jgi:DNA-binding NarL/FixJ family response regulator
MTVCLPKLVAAAATVPLSAIFAKLQVADRTQAVLRARDAGLGHP